MGHHNFNPRSRKESDYITTKRSIKARYFNPRSRKESDFAWAMHTVTIIAFQSTLSQGERLINMQKHGGRLQFQSTLSQGERLCRRQTRQECKGISIHALARRATVDVDYNNDGIYISIHALARRATPTSASKLYLIRFQSTLSQGERPKLLLRHRRDCNFNPRSRKESDCH